MLYFLDIKVPTYSALCKSKKRIPIKIWNSLLKRTANFESFSVAVDSIGFSRKNPSFHFVKRINTKNPVESLRKYDFNQFKEAKKGNINKGVIRWIQEKLNKNLRYLQNLKTPKVFGFS